MANPMTGRRVCCREESNVAFSALFRFSPAKSRCNAKADHSAK